MSKKWLASQATPTYGIREIHAARAWLVESFIKKEPCADQWSRLGAVLARYVSSVPVPQGRPRNHACKRTQRLSFRAPHSTGGKQDRTSCVRRGPLPKLLFRALRRSGQRCDTPRRPTTRRLQVRENSADLFDHELLTARGIQGLRRPARALVDAAPEGALASLLERVDQRSMQPLPRPWPSRTRRPRC